MVDTGNRCAKSASWNSCLPRTSNRLALLERKRHQISLNSSNHPYFHQLTLTVELFAFTNNVVGRATIGDRCKDQAEVILLINDLTASAGGFDVADLYPSIKIL
ncbi:Uncharacterized protein Adt_36507 [Abeliophyllum distichum]|uniref:Uncharacterized protein n=1 Tax=Abeliophyllum distichum TaxID=126358 RepID=A0ABD1QI62_9LAMI